jgi:hypothetical protein
MKPILISLVFQASRGSGAVEMTYLHENQSNGEAYAKIMSVCLGYWQRSICDE